MMWKFSTALLMGASVLAMSAAHAQQAATPTAEEEAAKTETSSYVGRIEVQGAGTALGSGYIIREETPKARSTVTREGLNNIVPSSNPYQAINVLPGIRQDQDDATGLFGGDITVRGLRADQLGFTINGAPVNDSGNFAVYPQEYTDNENLAEIFVTQGSADTDAPHVGASGGNIGIVSTQPLDYLNFRVAQTIGEENLFRTFGRFDTGWISGGDAKMFISYSLSDADKWRGEGTADRAHVDGQFYLKIADASSFSVNWLYNDAINNFYRQMSKSQYETLGRDFEYDTFWGSAGYPIHLTGVNGVAQNESLSVVSPEYGINTTRSNFWPLQVNPFRNAVVNVKWNLQLADDLRLDIEPYLWWGYGGGGFGRTESEAGSVNGMAFGDLNGDGDQIDTILLYRSSVTRTRRPGVITKFTWEATEDLTFKVGGWYEKAQHRQTQPYSYVDDNGVPLDVWALSESCNTVVCVDGQTYAVQGRDQLTKTTGYSFFGEGTVELFDDALKITGGLAYRAIERDGYALLPIAILTEGNPSYDPDAKYPQVNYNELLPSAAVSYNLDETSQFFASATKNMRAPSNFVLFTYNGAGTAQIIDDNIRAETSWVYEAGYRYTGEFLTASVTGFYNDFQDYLATAQIDPTTKTTANIGGVVIQGVELEVGTAPWEGFTFYASATYTDSELQDDLANGVSGGIIRYLPTAGKELTDTPEWLLAASIGYENSGFFASITPKYVDERFFTLMNDGSVDSYVTVDASLGYRFDESWGMMKGAKITLFGRNLFDEDYLGQIESTSTPNATSQLATDGVYVFSAASTNFTPGSPAFVGVTLTVDFGESE
ncbi:MAG: TonB-dependent receptor [Alphaproteobacteria bacterium]|nr:TonB-dependent receptor [Alphaproteobacteria bacterium]